MSICHNMIQQPGVEIIASAIYLETTRRGIEQSGHLVVFRHLLDIFRLSRASNPGDMIYALLSLAWKELHPFSSHPGLSVPDYEISVRDLFIKTARVMLECTNDFQYLCHVEDRLQRKLHGLPSWVPDYTPYLRPSTFYLQRFPGPNMYRNAGKGLEKYQNPGGLTSDQLFVSGFRLSRLTHRSIPFRWANMWRRGLVPTTTPNL
ncbi:uncharacterized protein K444DRAFT_54175 [Hyaloscypha bicolor E]|uniref:Uncharacterized protein n=1 Tax=Hyaloscypha bicolor E TaxID=1095630 RepID=A0A2J6T347_9HELO|nr:uncharacterized protein K444DRAFT_54175 [Hyaloscypha bicolor E]PMD57448.1 hypothetical protein K444DRAFT_54175 [Hyaloscypha bicolor E]